MKIDRAQDTELLTQATRHIQSGNLDDAIATLKELIDLNPRHEIATGMLAGVYAEIGMHDRALQFFQRVLDINPRNSLAGFQLGLLHYQTQHPDAALATWRATQPNDDDYVFNYYRGLALVELSRADEARILLGRAARHMPVNYALRAELDSVLAKLGPP